MCLGWEWKKTGVWKEESNCSFCLLRPFLHHRLILLISHFILLFYSSLHCRHSSHSPLFCQSCDWVYGAEVYEQLTRFKNTTQGQTDLSHRFSEVSRLGPHLFIEIMIIKGSSNLLFKSIFCWLGVIPVNSQTALIQKLWNEAGGHTPNNSASKAQQSLL